MLRAFLLAVAVCVIAPASASAIILGNYPPANDGTQTATVNDQRQKSWRFTMGSESLGAGDLVLRLGNYTTSGEAIAELREFTGDLTFPGAVLMSFDAPAPGGAAIQDYTFTPSSSFTLQANSTYFLVVRGIAGGSFNWMASSPGIPPTGAATFNQTLFTINGGTSWSNSGILNTFEFRIIPEPGSLGALLAGIGLLARRRR